MADQQFGLCRENHSNSVLAASVEQLETRQLLSGGPQFVGVSLLGQVRACTGIVLTFDRSMDPASVEDVKAYSIGRVTTSSGGSSSFFPFLARLAAKPIKNNKVVFSSAVYDDATHSVTLIPNAPFLAWKYFRAMRIKGTGADVVRDAQGNPLDGNGDGVGGDDLLLSYSYHHGKSISFLDPDGDRARVTLHGPGVLFIIKRYGHNPTPMIYLDGGNPARSVVSGKVKKSRHGDGVADILQFSGISSGQVTLVNNPQFRIAAALA